MELYLHSYAFTENFTFAFNVVVIILFCFVCEWRATWNKADLPYPTR